MNEPTTATRTRRWSSTSHLAGVVSLCVAGILPFASALPAGATTPSVASGDFTFTSDNQTPTRFAGKNVVISETSQLAYTGDLSGVATDVDSFVAHSDGSFEGHGVEVCDPCTLWGRTGAFISSFTFRGSGDSYVGQQTVLKATGGLTGLHGTGTFQGLIAENTNSYSYKLQFN